MSKRSLAFCLILGLAVSAQAATPNPAPGAKTTAAPKAASATAAGPALPRLTAAQIADKNAAARGGLAKWRAVKAIEMSGRLEAGGKVETYLPYTAQVKRPHMQRVAIQFAGQTAVQVFDGNKGWKLRPYLGRNDAEPFSAEELKKSAEQDLEGGLIDYAAKGSKLDLEGTETVDGKATYRLKLTAKDDHVQHLWIDGATFLEAKIEGHPRHFDGRMRQVETYPSDYRSVDGLMIPYVAETRLEGVRQSHKLTVEKVAVNPVLSDSLFSKPQSLPAPAAGAARGVPTVGAATAAPAADPLASMP
jgi:outer membrane lipoprotein-sorting protein